MDETNKKTPGYFRRKASRIKTTSERMLFPSESSHLIGAAWSAMTAQFRGKTFHPKNTDELLRGWGIDRKDVPNVIANLNRESTVLMFFIGLGVLGMLIGTTAAITTLLFGGVITTLIALVHYLIDQWRIAMLGAEQFTPFVRWIITGGSNAH